MPLHNRLGVVIALMALALLASVTLTWPTHDVYMGGLSFTLSGRLLLGLITIGLGAVGTDAIVLSNPRIHLEQLQRPFLWLILPTAVTAAAWVLLARLPNLESRVMGIAAHAGALVMLISAEYHAADPAAHGRRAIGVFLQFATYAVAALLYGAIHPTLLHVNVARAGTVVSAILALRLLGEDELPLGRILWASAGIGLLLGAISWLLHPRIMSPVSYSLTLVVILYVLVGLIRQLLWGKLRREVVLEYLLVGLAALVLLSFFAR